jgi:hypothetical protein
MGKKIDEFVNQGGGVIRGSKKYNQSDSATSSKSTTDKTIKTARQPTGSIYLYGRRYAHENDMSKHPLYDTYKTSKNKEDFIKNAKLNNNDDVLINDSVELFYKTNESYLDKMIEDVLNKKINYFNDILDKEKEYRSFDDINNENPIIKTKIDNFINFLTRLNDEMKKPVLNYFKDSLDDETKKILKFK